MLTPEASARFAKFEPWLNEPSVFLQPYEERGLKKGAPEEVKAIYADFLDMVELCHKSGTKW